MKTFVKTVGYLVLAFVASITLSACGGGGSDSGGGAQNSNFSSASEIRLVRRSGNVASPVGRVFVNINGSLITITHSDITYSGSVSDNTFFASVSSSRFSVLGNQCSGPMNVSGTVSPGTRVTGSFDLNLNCGISGSRNTPYRGRFSGSFVASFDGNAS